MNEKTFWLEADKRAIITRFGMCDECVMRDSARYTNLERAIDIYRELSAAERAPLEPYFTKFCEALTALFGEDDFDTREAAVVLVRRLDALIIPYLLQALNNPNALIREHVLRTLPAPSCLATGDNEEARILRTLATLGRILLLDPASAVRRYAVELVGAIKHDATAGFLAYALKHDGSAYVRKIAAMAFSEIGSIEHLKILGEVARSQRASREWTDQDATILGTDLLRFVESQYLVEDFVASNALEGALAIAKRSNWTIREEATLQGKRFTLQAPPGLGEFDELIDCLLWSDDQHLFESRLLQKSSGRGRFCEIREWDLISGMCHVRRSDILTDAQASQSQALASWLELTAQAGCPTEILTKLKGLSPQLTFPLPAPLEPLSIGAEAELLACSNKENNEVQLWRLPPLKHPWFQPYHWYTIKIPSTSRVQWSAFSQDGHYHVAASDDLILVDKGLLTLGFSQYQGPAIRGITLSPNGRYLAMQVEAEQELRCCTMVWDLTQHPPRLVCQLIYTSFCLPSRSLVPQIGFNRASDQIAAGLGVCTLGENEAKQTLKLPLDPQQGACLVCLESRFSADGKAIIATAEGVNPRFLEGYPIGDLVDKLGGDCFLVDWLSAGPDVISHSLVIWDITGSENAPKIYRLDDLLAGVKELRLSPYGDFCTGIRHCDKMLQLFAWRQNRVFTLGSTPQKRVIGFSPDGLALASVSVDDEIHIWELSSLLGSS